VFQALQFHQRIGQRGARFAAELRPLLGSARGQFLRGGWKVGGGDGGMGTLSATKVRRRRSALIKVAASRLARAR
jgi:hypothetical protein